MSSVVISGDTSGSVTLQAPSVAGTTVLTLPATSGTVITGPGGVVAISGGGTGQTTAAGAFNALNPMTTVGDIIYEGTGPAAARLPIGTSGQLLTVSGGIPAWATVSSTPTTDQVLTATAGATANAVGTYAFLGMSDFTGTAITVNSNYAGSKFCFAGFRLGSNASWTTTSDNAAQGGFGGGSPSGTWKAMGEMNMTSNNKGTVFLRVS